MDSTHEEPELPSAIQDLVQRLEGQGEPLTRLPGLSWPEFGEFFPERASLSTMTGWRSQVRLRVLEAIGNCNTFKSLNVGDICGGDISRLTASEWEIVFRGFRSSTVLNKINLYRLNWSSDAEVETLCLELGRILNSSSVTQLVVQRCRLSARCWSNLASGLRGHSDSKLQSLELLGDAWEDESAVKHVDEMINSAPLLETLELEDFREDMEDETVGILSQTLIQSSSLRDLVLGGAGKWGGPLLLKALAGDDRNRSIEHLLLAGIDGLGDCLREVLISNPSLKKVELYRVEMSPEEWHQLGEVIRDNAIATTILVVFDFECDDWKSIEALARSASSDVNDPTLELVIDTRREREDDLMLSLNLLGRVLRREIKSVKSLELTPSSRGSISFSILPMNGKTGETSVQKRLEISVQSEHLSKGEWEELLRCMRENHLTHLDLSDSELDEEAFRDVMGVLESQVNLGLQEIDVSQTSWARDGKAAQIQQALQHNKERAGYMSVFREANLTFGDAKAGRLFLCGSPRAGKTQLRKTLMRINQGKSWLGNQLESLFRTKGIEVEFLVNNDNMQISVWDLAGQWIFRTLQTVLFPQTYNFCIFLFVYSPLCEETSSIKPESCFRTELEEWLSFITSSTKVTGRDLPQIIVVISHKDKAKSSSLSWAHTIVEELTKRFTKFVDLRPIQECFYVDGRKKKQVSSLNRHIFENFHKLLREKSPQVPDLCLQLTSLLVTETKKNESFPLWPTNKFYDFCAPHLTSFVPSSSVHSDNHSGIIKSIISYLNDVGSIIHIPNLDYIIVNPNWLTNTFLGELIALGQHFQAQESESSNRTSSYASKSGFVSEIVFARLIEKFLAKQSCFQNVDRKVLENILINLDLCFKLENTSEYFIPSFIPEHASKEKQNDLEGAHVMKWENSSEISQFVGIRIECQDRITMSLTAAFFPRFQMFMRRKLISEEMGVSENVICSRHFLLLFLDGHQIYIEHVQGEKCLKYVDVLMLCSSQKSREAAITYVRKHIVQELISFCASPKGCPGVALVLGVIQTSCVKMLIPSHLRGAILIEKLKSDFIRSINDKLEEMPSERSHLMQKEELFHYEHCWPAIGRDTGRRSELARDLLWQSDVEAVVNEIHQNRIQQLKSLEEGIISVDNGLALCYPEAENMVSGSDAPQMKDLKPLSSRCLSRSNTSVENRSTQLVLFKIQKLEEKMEQKFDSLDERLRSMQSSMEQILSMQQEVQSKLSVFMSKVDMIIGYSQVFQQGKTPKRPYVTDDVGYLYRLSAGLHVGTIVRLHLMCESMTGFHTVEDQEGLKIRLDSEKWGWIRKTIEISYKVIYYAAKAALTKFCELGDAIPAWADLESDIVKLDVSSEDRKAVLTGGDSQELQEAWLRIKQILAPELQNRYSKIFKLYQVKYVSLEKGGYAFGSDVQGLEASGNDQHVSKADDKLEEKGMATVPDAAVEVVSVPKPPPPVLCRRNRLVEKKPELWTWPARGGDWKLYAYQVENPQPVVGEKAQVHSLVQKKVVLNGGHPFCDGKVRDPRDQRKRDPRKRELQNPAEESAKLNGVDWSKLEVPKFALKLGNTTDDPNVTQSQHLMTTPKGGHAATTSVQGSTPSAHLTQGRLSLGGPGTGSKAAKVSSTLALVPATGTKSGGPVIHPQAVSNSARIVHQSSKHELLIVKKNSIFNKHRSLPRAAGVGDGRLKPTSERILQQTGRPEAAVRDRPSEHQQGFDGEPSKVVPKKVFSRRDLPSRDTLKLHDGPWFYLDGMGREMGPFSHAEIQSLVSNQKLFEGSSVYRKDDDLWVPVSVPSIERPISSPADSGIPSESGQKCRLASLTKPPAAKHTSESSTIQTSLNDGSRYSPSEPLPPAVSVSENSDPKSRESCAPTNNVSKAVSFHDIHPQFLGFTRGKLHEYVMKSFKSASLPAALYEGLEKWFQAKEKEKISIAPLPALHGSPASSVPTPAAVKCRANDDAGGSSPRYERQSQNQSALTGRRSAHGTPSSSYDDVAKTVETEAWSRATSVGQNGKTGEELSPSKRKAWALEDSKQNRRSSQKRRLLDSEESDGDEKGGHSTRAIVGDLPHLIDDNPFRSPDMVPQDLVSGGQEKGWATLKFGTLRMIFRHLRGDVKALTNASAACKSWMAAGKVCKTELKSVDLSSVRGQRLDALMEALPGFRAPKLKRLILKGCTNVKPESLAEVLRACPSISAVEIDSLVPFKELTHMFPKVRWVTEQFGVQSPRDHISRKRDEIHFKTKSLRVIGESKAGYLRDSVNRESDDFEMHLVSDSASKVRSPSGFACNVNTDLEATTNDSLQDSETTHSARTPNGAKHFKLNNGSKKFDSSNGYAKTSKRENGDSMSHLPHVKRKTLTTSSHRKHEQAIYRRGKPLSGSQRGISDKGSASSVKGEFPSKGYGMLSMLEGEKSLEKEIGLLLREMMEADTSRVFQPASIATEVKGDSSKSGKTIDLWMMEKKHRNGAYSSGKNGFDAFRDDVKLLIRNGFRNPHDNPVLQATKRIFKVTHSYFEAKDNQSAGRSSVEIQMQSKSFGARPFGKVEKGRSKAPTMSQHRPGKKRKVWEDDGVQKGKIGSAKKGRQGDWSDVDSDSDSERETRRFSKSKKERSWDSDEGDSSEDEEDGFMEGDEEETETEPSDSDIPSESEGEDGDFEADNYDTDDDMEFGYLDWGARMTKAAMVPPVTRKYVVIEEYRIVADEDRVLKKMQVELPKDFASLTALEKAGDHYSHLDIPEIKEYQPRKRLGEEVMEQEVYGIDPYTHNLLLDTMPVETTYFTEAQRQQFIEERLLLVLNKEGSKYTGTGKAPMEYPLERVVQRIASEAEICKDWALYDFADQLLVNMKARQRDKFVAYRKGLGVVCNKAQGLEKDEFVVEFFGEVYPPWRWYEKQDGIRSLQKKDKDPTPEFYNIYYERPKGDAAGYDLLVVDAMHKANFASRLCHSCRPNCEAKITAVNDTYIIGVYSLKPIKRGEELTFDYNSVTESKEEYNNAVCLCGSQGCRGSYLNLTGSGTFEEVIARDHGLLDRHRLLLNACSPAPITNEEIEEMRQAGLGSCVLSGLPTWAVKYAARLVHFMNFEKTHLPAELLKDFDLKRKQGVVEGSSEVDAEITTEGVYNQRLQNLTITLDKVRHILTELFDKPGLAPPPVRKLDLKEMVQWIWKKENSVVNELLQCLAPHLEREKMLQFKESVGRNSPNDSGNNLHLSLLWLRDALRRLPATCKARHDAAADLIHMYANTKHFFVLEDYAVVKSTPVLITPLDLGTKHSLTGNRRWSKVYSKEYVWGQLINWFKQKAADPGASLAKSSRGCLVLPDVSSCYARSIQHDFRLAYGPKHREKMIFYMEHKPEQKWPKSKIWSKFWSFKNERGLFGSPMLDSVLEGRPLRDEMMRWLKIREDTFVGPWDEQ